MIAAFTLPSSPEVAFGAGRIADLGVDITRIAGQGAKVALICDPFVAESGLVDMLSETLKATGHASDVFSDVRSDPLASQIDAAAKAIRSANASLVVAVGGGSAMDVGKMAAAVAAGSVPTKHYELMANPLPEATLPVICIPTTSGTGSEATRTVVFTNEDGAKVWAWGEQLAPRMALLDPHLTVSLPAALTAATGVDALVHAIEAVTNRRAHPLNDGFGLQSISLIRQWLPVAVSRPSDLEARGAMQLAACLAGMAINGSGTGIAHCLGHALGSLGHVHHGRAVGLSLRVVLSHNAEAAPRRHATVARAFGLGGATTPDEELTRELPAAYDRFLREVGLRIDLSDHLSSDDADALGAEALKPENRPMLDSNCRAFAEGEVRGLARELLEAR